MSDQYIYNKFNEIRKRKTGTEKVKVLAFGSSNTERFITGLHWFDCFELAIKNKYWRIHHCINSGIGGDTSTDLLNRFDTDADFYKPDMVFITIGGNDANPGKNLDAYIYENNLFELYTKFKAINCFVIFQTYYATISEEVEKKRYETFCKYMNITREVAKKTDSGLIDHFKHWIPLEQKISEQHRKLMNDTFHVNSIGNIVLGLYISRIFKINLADTNEPFYKEANSYLQLMDQFKGEKN